jgi:hypothetical protein
MSQSILRILLAALLMVTLVAAAPRDSIARRSLDERGAIARGVLPSRTLRQVTGDDIIRRSRARANLEGLKKRSTPSPGVYPSCDSGVTASGYAHFSNT